MGLAADLIFVALVVFTLVIGWKRGFFRSMMDLIGTLLVLAVSIWLSGVAAEWAFQEMLRGPMIAQIAEALETASADNAAEVVFSALPSIFSGALELYGITADTVNQAIANTSGSAAVAAVDLMAPAVISVLKAVLALVLFLFLLALMRILTSAICRVLRLPLLRQLDQCLGAVLGGVQGIAVVFLLCFCAELLAPVSSPWLREMVEGSQICRIFSGWIS